MNRLLPDLTLIVPVFNEEGSVLACFQELQAMIARCVVSVVLLFVNDGSTDRTEEELRRHRIPHITQRVNTGYGAAIKEGARHAATPWVGIIDCDLTYPADEVPRLLAHAEGVDMVVGARDVRLNPWINRQCKRAVCGLLGWRFGRRVDDINSGLRLIRRDVFLRYAPAVCDRFSLTSSITLGFLLDGHPIAYVPIAYRPRVGETKVRPWSYTRDFLAANWAMYRFCRDPQRRPYTLSASV